MISQQLNCICELIHKPKFNQFTSFKKPSHQYEDANLPLNTRSCRNVRVVDGGGTCVHDDDDDDGKDDDGMDSMDVTSLVS